VPREGLAGYRAPIEAAGYALDRLDVCDPKFADADFLTPDLVILMGGPMGVYEGFRHPWIPHEIERVAERLEHGLPTLGVCFGAQLIAAALGADVYAGPRQEIGFAPLTLTDAGRSSALAHLDAVPVLHWHGDTFDLPRDTELLASTDSYRHQGFRRGGHLLALQFHAEMGVDPRIEEWIAESTDSLEQLGFAGEELRDHYAAHGPAAVTAGQRMVADWIAQLTPALDAGPVAQADAISLFGQI
jgi:GMP synthase (glutamine-hydrolysing)